MWSPVVFSVLPGLSDPVSQTSKSVFSEGMWPNVEVAAFFSLRQRRGTWTSVRQDKSRPLSQHSCQQKSVRGQRFALSEALFFWAGTCGSQRQRRAWSVAVEAGRAWHHLGADRNGNLLPGRKRRDLKKKHWLGLLRWSKQRVVANAHCVKYYHSERRGWRPSKGNRLVYVVTLVAR